MKKRGRPPGVRYDVDSYRRAIERGCDLAFPPPEHLARAKGETGKAWRERLGPKKWAELARWRAEHRWHPHQLRHNFATGVRRVAGLEAAQVLLGHQSADVTQVYAEADRALAMRVIAGMG